VDAPYQLRAGVLVGAVAIVLLALLNASLMLQNRAAASTAAVAAARPLLGGHDRVSWALLAAGSAIFLAGVVLVGVLESHRTAGAAYAIRRAVDAIRQGTPDVRVRLRRSDHLQELAASINKLAEAIDAERRART
jgi:signal transduction histidine kinase